MKIYLVGGAVRDNLLKLPVKDRDWVVVGATPNELIKKGFKQVGKDFPVFLHPKTFEEYALARTEKKLGVGYKGFQTNHSKRVTLNDDLIRRDLTINAIAQDVKGNFIDPFNGIQDLKLRLLRHVSKAFKEDPLRILRVARFSAQLSHLGFQVEKNTMKFMKIMVGTGELSFLTSHRIWNETKKALISYSPHVYFYILRQCNALSVIFPEINYLYNIKIKNLYFKNNNLGEHFLFSLSNFSKFNLSIELRFAFLCQFFIYYRYIYRINKKFKEDFFQSNLIKNMFIRLNIPIFIRKLSYISSNNYFFLHNIFLKSSKDIICLFNKIDVWRNPSIIIKLGILSEYCIFFPECKYHCKRYDIKNFLKIIFIISSSISIKWIIKSGFKGYYIKKELIKLRTLLLEIYRLKIFLIK
ncbi:Multifunctional CCA protein [Buchnera aphidicola (Periphyllus testudinaceus)]|uniref:tRNA CCA-pyrophosphorylase n=1 Tax=Buchnera aphidicola TaxID=9 RepID=UPI003463A0AD